MADETDVGIRWLMRLDMSQVLTIERETFAEAWTDEDFHLAGGEYGVVAERRGRVVGYAVYRFQSHEIEVLNLAVARGYRRLGIGRQLVTRLCRKLRPGGRTRVVLLVRESNVGGQVFFRACGFRAVRVLRGIYERSSDDAYEMVYAIDSTDSTSRR